MAPEIKTSPRRYGRGAAERRRNVSTGRSMFPSTCYCGLNTRWSTHTDEGGFYFVCTGTKWPLQPPPHGSKTSFFVFVLHVCFRVIVSLWSFRDHVGLRGWFLCPFELDVTVTSLYDPIVLKWSSLLPSASNRLGCKSGLVVLTNYSTSAAESTFSLSFMTSATHLLSLIKLQNKWKQQHPGHNRADPYYLLTFFRLRTGHNRLKHHRHTPPAPAEQATRQQNICCSPARSTKRSDRKPGPIQYQRPGSSKEKWRICDVLHLHREENPSKRWRTRRLIKLNLHK